MTYACSKKLFPPLRIIIHILFTAVIYMCCAWALGRSDNQDAGNMIATEQKAHKRKRKKKKLEPKEKYPTAHHLIFVVLCFSSFSHGDGMFGDAWCALPIPKHLLFLFKSMRGRPRYSLLYPTLCSVSVLWMMFSMWAHTVSHSEHSQHIPGSMHTTTTPTNPSSIHPLCSVQVKTQLVRLTHIRIT